MLKKISLIIIVMLIIPLALLAQNKSPIIPHYIDDGASLAPSGVENNEVFKNSQLTWALIDSMNNCYGMLSNRVKPFAYDPYTGAVVFLHRGQAGYGASGQLWYNMSMDGATTWRRVSEVNAGNANNSRYPSCAISNPTNSSDTSVALFVFSAPQLYAGAWGATIYGVDLLGSAGPYSVQDVGDATYWSNTTIWTERNSPWVLWTTRRGSPNSDFYLWRTQDYVTVDAGVPTTWANANFSDLGLDIGGKFRNGVNYFGTWAVWPGDDTLDYNVGYSKSTDNGATWSAWIRPQPSWRNVSGVSQNSFWWDYGNGYSFDMLVDADNRVHFFGVAQDTLTSAIGVIEIYETATGWDSKIITSDLKISTDLTYDGLDQMGTHLNSAISPDGNVMAIYWLDAPVPGDSLADIWFASRHINTNWSTPVNLTETPAFHEILLHVAPTLKYNGGDSYTAFVGRAYEARSTTYPPNDVATTFAFTAKHTFTQLPVSVRDDENIPNVFQLRQNYPNPFNPVTSIKYSVPERSKVSLKIYDILGSEVATIVNDTQEAGIYETYFDASNLSSGVYIYTLKAGSNIGSKKMILMK